MDQIPCSQNPEFNIISMAYFDVSFSTYTGTKYFSETRHFFIKKLSPPKKKMILARYTIFYSIEYRVYFRKYFYYSVKQFVDINKSNQSN